MSFSQEFHFISSLRGGDAKHISEISLFSGRNVLKHDTEDLFNYFLVTGTIEISGSGWHLQPCLCKSQI